MRTTENQGMYKNRVKNSRNFFEIPTLLSCEQGNPEWENSKLYMYTILNSPTMDFPIICLIFCAFVIICKVRNFLISKNNNFKKQK